MNSELKFLEEEVHQLVRLYQDTCIENTKLRQQITETNARNEKLTEKIHIASSRLEILLKHLPDNE
ncbi:MAG TPA: hypothetical protein PKM20_04705 [Nitrosomonas sp.]|uniref:hypothetical protein n=1 Tax=Nitrosomonas sp. TaxID=42353 RepID=UPI000E9BA318|nr:hypothetical protein [Nitrosomonas sp.]GJL74867.1 MAG: hypothetical protein NMNS02_09730 [Nitrosomonas sp.]HBV21730.1 hypothetical protein [Nitrosomonas sp.]HNP26018.1 hypothetical protein [Nitrosomonas sp.]